MFGFLIQNAYAMGTPAAQGGAQPTGPAAIFANPIFMMVIIMVIFYFFLIAPQRKEQKRHQERLNNLKVGDKVITSGGIHGIITNASGDVLKVKVADNVKLDISRTAIVSVQSAESPVAPEK